jgi:hypothetical protein
MILQTKRAERLNPALKMAPIVDKFRTFLISDEEVKLLKELMII